MCPIHDVRTVLYGWKADLCKKRMGFQKYKYNKITSIKDKKKEDGASKKKTDDETENQLR